MRRLVAGTGWKMNIGAAEATHYAQMLRTAIAGTDLGAIDLFVLPPFTSLHAAKLAFAGSPVAIGGQNMHWEEALRRYRRQSLSSFVEPFVITGNCRTNIL